MPAKGSGRPKGTQHAHVNVPWANPSSMASGTRTGWAKSKQSARSGVAPSKRDDLYLTFKDDMQKMEERTYFRANGVKVCKVSGCMLCGCC